MERQIHEPDSQPKPEGKSDDDEVAAMNEGMDGSNGEYTSKDGFAEVSLVGYKGISFIF